MRGGLPEPRPHRAGLLRRQHQPGGGLGDRRAQHPARPADWRCWSRSTQLRQLEVAGDYTGRLALLEELKGLPFGAVWDYYCLQHGVPVGLRFMDEVRAYEKKVLAKRKLILSSELRSDRMR